MRITKREGEGRSEKSDRTVSWRKRGREKYTVRSRVGLKQKEKERERHSGMKRNTERERVVPGRGEWAIFTCDLHTSWSLLLPSPTRQQQRLPGMPAAPRPYQTSQTHPLNFPHPPTALTLSLSLFQPRSLFYCFFSLIFIIIIFYFLFFFTRTLILSLKPIHVRAN